MLLRNGSSAVKFYSIVTNTSSNFPVISKLLQIKVENGKILEQFHKREVGYFITEHLCQMVA